MLLTSHSQVPGTSGWGITRLGSKEEYVPTVTLKYLAPICDIAKTYTEQVTIDEGMTLVQLAERLSVRYGSPFRKLFFDKNTGEFRPMFIVNLNGQPMEAFDVVLQDGDTLAFIPPIAGG